MGCNIYAYNSNISGCDAVVTIAAMRVTFWVACCQLAVASRFGSQLMKLPVVLAEYSKAKSG